MNIEGCVGLSLLVFLVVCCRVCEYACNLRLVPDYVLTFEFTCTYLYRLRTRVDAYPIVLFLDYDVAWHLMEHVTDDYPNYDTGICGL